MAGADTLLGVVPVIGGRVDKKFGCSMSGRRTSVTFRIPSLSFRSILRTTPLSFRQGSHYTTGWNETPHCFASIVQIFDVDFNIS